MKDDLPLGRVTGYPERYEPGLLRAIPRSEARNALGLHAELPFRGVDIWNAWELTWLDASGKPLVAAAEIRIPATSPHIVESKSVKLYLNSFSMTPFDEPGGVASNIERDVGRLVGEPVSVRLHLSSERNAHALGRLPGECLDSLAARCDGYDVDAGLLRADPGQIVSEELYSHLLRSLCPVTGQPDTGSLLVSYRGPRIERESLLRYIVSFRRHNDFHEACAERIFTDLVTRCGPTQLSVYARYHRRGGIDINPFRSDFEDDPPNIRLWRQ